MFILLVRRPGDDPAAFALPRRTLVMAKLAALPASAEWRLYHCGDGWVDGTAEAWRWSGNADEWPAQIVF